MKLDPVDLSMKLIEYPSVTFEKTKVLDFVEELLSSMGFVCSKFVFDDEGSPAVENLYAKFGNSTPVFCFAGHLDVVPAGDLTQWTSEPFKPEIRDGNLYGRGACDMKCAIACFISAVSEFLKTSSDIKGSISLLLTCDEEGPAINGTKKVLKELEKRGEVITDCLVGEPTSSVKAGDIMKIGRRGSVNFTLEVMGKQGHIAYPHLALNPIDYLLKALLKIKEISLDNGNEYFDASNLEISNLESDNKVTNVIPGVAKGFFNIRFNNIYNGDQLIKLIDETCSSVLSSNPEISYNLISRISAESFLTKPCRLHEVVKSSIVKVVGTEPEVNTKGGTSDARFIKDYANIVELGLRNATAHKIDEHVSVDGIKKLYEIYLNILNSYF